MKNLGVYLFFLTALLSSTSAFPAPLGTAFVYQGSLEYQGQPANGGYDFEFWLFDAAVGGNVLGGPLSVVNLQVSDGIFSTEMDFGAAPFDGQEVWLQIRVKPAFKGSMTTLSPRHLITRSPYAIRSQSVEFLDADSVGSSQVVDGSLTMDDLDNNTVQARVDLGCAPGSAIRVIDNVGDITCELDDSFVEEGVFSANASSGNTTTINGPLLGGTLCFLSQVFVSDADQTLETVGCSIGKSATRWQLAAWAYDNDSAAECEMRCISGGFTN